MVTRTDFWKGKRVLVTGHTGFKGSWLSLILTNLGAEVIGISLPPENEFSLYHDAKVSNYISDEAFIDIRNFSEIDKYINGHSPQYLFHLAAQPLVRESLLNPLETYSINIQGTANVLISTLSSKAIEGCVIATTDKVYKNESWEWPYRETDRIGGRDPYSASKAATELVVSSIRESLNPKQIPITTVRAGNVIGGGDWAKDRIIPDLIRCVKSDRNIVLRNPSATRPWQHVLDCLNGYLLVAEKQNSHISKPNYVAFNFGPNEDMDVESLARLFLKNMLSEIQIDFEKSQFEEEHQLSLDSSRARKALGWKLSLNTEEAIQKTAEWYRVYLTGTPAFDVTMLQIGEYFKNV